ncbi:winged helix-turn-helix domain-containing protein [Micromonospora sp. NPDC005806]|uniref:winged helix-turn-helix domain-containing protein n=1 Tax=Micromonospora sp. NPDC005806 TaxID=3364234 RepID=UPI0036B8CB17
MTAIPSLVIGIASSAAERRQLAQLLGGTEAFLIVSSAHQARRFLDLVRKPGAAAGPPPVGNTPAEGASDAGLPPRPDLSIDSDRRVLRWRDREIGLTPLEHDLLLCLVGTPGQVWTYRRLHLEVWGNEHLGRGSDMHSLVRRVRRKLARLGATPTIHAVRGVGFRLASA